MCGIMGYVGHRPALPIVLDGLKRLEYRGYDSAGIALLDDTKLILRKCCGKVAELEQMWRPNGFRATLGMGHTRWATHGDPSLVNAHPHMDCTGQIAIIHNGIVENSVTLRNALKQEGHRFTSETDTEVVVHLVEESYKRNPDLEHAVRSALKKVVGAYAIVVMSEREPNKLVAARKGSPLAIGIGKGEYIVASDASAIVEHTRDIMYLDDEEIAIVTLGGVTVKTLDDILVLKGVDEVLCDIQDLEKGQYPHFMLKEIYEQSTTVEDAMRGRLLEEGGTSKLGGIESVLPQIDKARRIILTACGTSWHAALTGKYMLEQYTHRSVSVEYASEFRYTNPALGPGDVVICISQSGETADTLAALREAKGKAALVLGICNVVGSTIARESDAGIYIHAGPEIGVASTKAFTSQLTVLSGQIIE